MAFHDYFRFAGDLSHVFAIFVLIRAIHSNRSAEGVSLITQALYLLVFCSRYLNIFTSYPVGPYSEGSSAALGWWNFFGKITFISSTAYTIAIMYRLFPRSREREKSWRLTIYLVAATVVGTPIASYTLGYRHNPVELAWVLSQILESICILPQLLLLRQTNIPTVIDSFYLLAMGSYRALYLIHWILRAMTPNPEGKGSEPDYISPAFGVIQTALYADFFWVYYSRQRVKLRGGGIVDSEDLDRGWLVNRIIGRKTAIGGGDEEEGGEEGTPRPRNHRWGARGISVSADDGVGEEGRPLRRGSSEQMTDPEAFEDDDAELDAVDDSANGNGTKDAALAKAANPTPGHLQPHEEDGGANWGTP